MRISARTRAAVRLLLTSALIGLGLAVENFEPGFNPPSDRLDGPHLAQTFSYTDTDRFAWTAFKGQDCNRLPDDTPDPLTLGNWNPIERYAAQTDILCDHQREFVGYASSIWVNRALDESEQFNVGVFDSLPEQTDFPQCHSDEVKDTNYAFELQSFGPGDFESGRSVGSGFCLTLNNGSSIFSFEPFTDTTQTTLLVGTDPAMGAIHHHLRSMA